MWNDQNHTIVCDRVSDAGGADVADAADEDSPYLLPDCGSYFVLTDLHQLLSSESAITISYSPDSRTKIEKIID